MSKAYNPIIKDDIQRYKKNKLGSMLALLGLVFCCVYFIVLYAQVKNGNYYYKWPIAIDVIYNLFFLLFVFLFSEQVKNYNRKLFWLQLVFGILQLLRIEWLPLAGMVETVYNTWAKVPFNGRVLSIGAFLAMSISLALSGACVIASGIIGFVRSKQLDSFNAKLANGEVDVDATLKQLDEEDEKKAAQAPATEVVEEVTNA